MNHGTVRPRHELYPAKYFDQSPTYNHWCKLSIADVLTLRQERGFEGQNVYFYLNHPIRFIYVVGLVVAIDDVSNYTLISLDDGSGQAINAKIVRNVDKAQPTKTLTEKVTVESGDGNYIVRVDGQRVEVGITVKAKGVISHFRGTRQLDLKRVTLVKDTTEEVALWEAMARFKRDTLLKPWQLAKNERDKIDRAILEQAQQTRKQDEHERRKGQVRAMRDADKRKRLIKAEQKAEKRKAVEEQRRLAEEREMNAGAIV